MTQLNADFDIDTPIDHNFHQEETARLKRWEATLSDDYWAYRREWEERPQKRIVGDVPLHLDLEATSACNLLCTMCPRTEMMEQGTFWKVQAFEMDAYRRIIDEGAKAGLRSIKYNYLGEPLANPQLPDMVRYAKDAGLVDVMFNTNAALLTEERSRQLIDAGLDKLFFSFDSPNPEDYNRIRVGADYYEVLHNIRRFHEIREEMGSVTPFTRVSMVLMQENRDQWEAYRELFHPIVDAVAYVDYLDHSGMEKSDRTLVAVGSRQKKFCCPQLWQRMFVHPDGVVTPCCIDAAREMQMGNVFENSLAEIWQGEAYQNLRAMHADGHFEQSPTCANCPLARY